MGHVHRRSVPTQTEHNPAQFFKENYLGITTGNIQIFGSSLGSSQTGKRFCWNRYYCSEAHIASSITQPCLPSAFVSGCEAAAVGEAPYPDSIYLLTS